MSDAIVERIQKLLSLANSDNENEAKMATARANELLIKYNLKMQEVVDRQFDYVDQNLATTGLTLKPYQKLIGGILVEFFFIRIVIARKHVGFSSGRWAYKNAPRSQYQKTIKLVGTSENCQIAAYIFTYLNDVFPKLWNEYKKNNECDASAKASYHHGLALGIKHMLEQTKWKVQNETGLVVLKDKKLDEHIKKTTRGTYGGDSSSEMDPEVVRDGVRDGKSVQLRKPLDSQIPTDSGKLLSTKK